MRASKGEAATAGAVDGRAGAGRLDRLRLLGVFEALDAAGTPVSLPTRKVRALVAILALQPSRRFGRDELAALLWPDADDGAARHSLRQALSSLRRVCPGLEIDARTVRLSDGVLEVDALRLERAVRAHDAAELEAVVADLDGDLLQDLESEGERFSAWLEAERARFRETARAALTRLVDHCREVGDPARAVDWAHRLIADDPFDETAHRSLLALYAEERRVSAAERHYEKLAAFLRHELGTAPEAATRAILERLVSPPAEAAMPRKPSPEAIAALVQVPVSLVVTDLSGRIEASSSRVARQGSSGDRLRWAHGHAAGRGDEFDGIVRAALELGSWEGFVLSTGHEGRTWCRVAPLLDRDGTPLGLIAVFDDGDGDGAGDPARA